MTRWQWLLAAVAAVQLGWGVMAFVDYARAVGATGDATSGWVFTALGLAGLLTLVWPRFGFLAAVGQAAVAAHALCWLPLALFCLRVWLGPFPLVPIPPAVSLLILQMAVTTAALCLLGALGSWQVARQRRVMVLG
ncbi:MAG: hypothetical protein U0736_04630 [Gemmataceae bacterium]